MSHFVALASSSSVANGGWKMSKVLQERLSRLTGSAGLERTNRNDCQRFKCYAGRSSVGIPADSVLDEDETWQHPCCQQRQSPGKRIFGS